MNVYLEIVTGYPTKILLKPTASDRSNKYLLSSDAVKMMTDYGITYKSQMLIILNINLKQAQVTETCLAH